MLSLDLITRIAHGNRPKIKEYDTELKPPMTLQIRQTVL